MGQPTWANNQAPLGRNTVNLASPIKDFAIYYLGIPLPIWKLCWTDFQPILDKLDNKLAHWRVSMMPKGGRLILIKVVLVAAPIHTMLATELPKRAHEAMRPLWDNNNLFSGVANGISMGQLLGGMA